MSRLLLPTLVAALLCASLPLVPVGGDEADDKVIGLDPDKIVPLKEILATVRRIAPGKVIDVELEYDVDLDDGDTEARWVYEIEVLTEKNQLVELEFDAETGQLLEIEGAPWPAGVPKPAGAAGPAR